MAVGGETMRLIIPVIVIFCFASLFAEERVIMKNGDVYEGKVLKRGDKEITLKTKYGELVIPLDDIKSIEKLEETEYIERCKKLAEEHYKLALWCKEQGKEKEAIEHLQIVIKLNPEHGDARRLLGFVKKDGKWVKEREPSDEPIPSEKPDKPQKKMSKEEWEAAHKKALGLLFGNRFEEALKIYEEILASEPNDYIAHYNIACAYARLGKKETAIEHLRKAVECGFSDLEKIKEDPDLESLREMEEFKKIVSGEVKPKKEEKQEENRSNEEEKKPPKKKARFF
ncbi:MAG: tetratricopeptide repeat protein [Planctomycetota bacterium]|nr:tetratricopeptide repeat protein [Planctomycetota bacterium]